jgi:hypothetical protein
MDARDGKQNVCARQKTGKEETMNLPILKMMALAAIGILIFAGYAAANPNVYKGELMRDRAKDGTLSSNEIWLFYGVKDSRVVISTTVDNGKAPPEIYLYPPDSSTYKVHSDVVSDHDQVLDYQIKSDGKYVVLIHPCDQQDKSSYKIAYTTIDPGETYTINPNAPKGDLIKVTNINEMNSDKFFIDKSGGLVPASIVFDLVTFGVGPALFTVFTGLDRVAVSIEEHNDRIEVESRYLEKPAGQCNVSLARNGS